MTIFLIEMRNMFHRTEQEMSGTITFKDDIINSEYVPVII